MSTRIALGKTSAITAVLGLFVISTLMSTGVGWAQEIATEDRTPAAIPVEPATAYPAELDDLSIGVEELQLRLIPLTADQLAPLAAAWLEHARAATSAGSPPLRSKLEITVENFSNTRPRSSSSASRS